MTTSGWNDPPSFTYVASVVDPGLVTSSPKPILLPCTQPDKQQQQQQDCITLHTVPTPSEFSNDIPMISIFRKSLSDNSNKFKPSVLSNLTSKLDLLDTSLKNSTIPESVLLILTELSQSVTAQDWTKAYQLHIKLLADYPTFVNGWILAIKKIILANQD